MKIKITGIWILLLVSFSVYSQDKNPLYVSGNFQVLAQTYQEDSLINAQVPDEKITLNSFANIVATKGKFQAGLRYESYLPQQLGYSEPNRYKGSGIGYRFVSYTDDDLNITVGNFYEQFGIGLVLRSFEDRNLGLENAMDGVKVGIEPLPGFYVKGVYGKMRVDFVDGIVNTDGFIRGVDGEIFINELDSSLNDMKTKIRLGGSFVSRFQADRQSNVTLPENVGVYGARLNLNRGNWSMAVEYAEKINDPSGDNSVGTPARDSSVFGQFIYNKGYAMQGNLTYSQKGFSFSADAKYLDNFSFRPDRTIQGVGPMINFHPALTKQHSYMLASQFYAYATQPTGEFAYMGELSYNFKKNTFLGGRYGTQLTVNYARATGIDVNTTSADTFNDTGVAYEPNFLKASDQVFFSDLNIELKKKWSKKVKTKFTYFNFIYDNDISQGAILLDGTQAKGTIYADVFVAEANIKTRKKQNLRVVAQMLRTGQHQGDWAGLVLEYTIAPHWNLSIVDLYNYGNSIEDNILHYPLGGVAYSKDAHRISFEYGKRRAGLFCVGGVCRVVPASNGLTITMTSNF
ncbi:MAG: DUF6029 family protein [Flavobacteriales bacterium]